MKKIIRILSVALALVLCMSVSSVAFAASAEPTAKLYSYYGDGMLFQQKKEAILAGEAVGVELITATVQNSKGTVVAKGSGYVNKSNRFSLSFTAPSGSYTEYTITLSADGKEFQTLNSVVFGELWLASGQSNMEMSLLNTDSGKKMMEEGKTGSKWIRFLQMPSFPEYKGEMFRFPSEAQRDIPGCFWSNASDAETLYSASAVAYYFAEELVRQKNVPVGVLCAYLGGSSIYSWLSRDTIESNAEVKADLIEQGRYYSLEDWQEDDGDFVYAMTVNYNKKIEALRNFRPTGMIWYQGESDLMKHAEPGPYTRAFELLQTSYSDLFGFPTGERMPIVYTQIANFRYGETKLQLFNVELSEIQQLHPESRAMTAIYDVPLDYDLGYGSIHPVVKAPVGQRMAYAAMGLVYGKHTQTSTAATVVSSECKDGSVYVTFRNTGDGLTSKNQSLKGFSVCGKDGIYVGATAEIVGKDTIRVSAPGVSKPVSAGYAMSQYNGSANLFAYDKTYKVYMPVSPFVTDRSVGTHYWQDREFATCDTAKTWHSVSEEGTGFYDIWSGQNAAVLPSRIAYSGEGSMRIVANAGHKYRNFSMTLVNKYSKGERLAKRFVDRDANYADYGKMTFMICNDGMQPLTLEGVRFYVSETTWYSASLNGTNDPQMKIPNDGKWYEVEVDLNSLYLFGNECGGVYSRNVLKDLFTMRLQFHGGAGASLLVDEFCFTPDSTKMPTLRFVNNLKNADTPFEFFTGLFTALIALIRK